MLWLEPDDLRHEQFVADEFCCVDCGNFLLVCAGDDVVRVALDGAASCCAFSCADLVAAPRRVLSGETNGELIAADTLEPNALRLKRFRRDSPVPPPTSTPTVSLT